MRQLLFLVSLLALFSFTAKAEVFRATSTIEGVDLPKRGREVLVFVASEGRVLRADSRDYVLVDALVSAKNENAIVEFSFNDDGQILSVMTVGEAQELNASEDKDLITGTEAFAMTTVASQEEAQKLFNTMNSRTKGNSQCFNRAMVWAHDMHGQYGVSSSKIFIFFTSRYIREFKYKWWFHVSPFLMVNTAAGLEERVIDREFTRGPLPVRAWTDIFMQNNVHCPEVKNYTAYRHNQEAQYCYLLKAPMYYWGPRDLERHESERRFKTGFVMTEIWAARKEAFKSWRSVYGSPE